MRELTDQQIDRTLTAGFAEESEKLAQARASSAEMTARVRAATQRRTYRRPLMLMAAALLMASGVAVWIGTRPDLDSPGAPVNCVSTLPEGWRLRLNLALSGQRPNIVTLDRDGLLIRGSENTGYAPAASWADRARSFARQLEPDEADGLVAAIDEAFPEGFCATIARDPTQVTGPSVESAGNHFVMINGNARQPARVSSTEETRKLNKLMSTLSDSVVDPDADQLFGPDSFDLIVSTYRGLEPRPDLHDVSNAVLPGGEHLATLGTAVQTSNAERCLTVSSDEADAWAAALDATDAWDSDSAAWLFSDEQDREVTVRLIERRPHQPACQTPLWPRANAVESVTSPMIALDPCELTRPEVTLSAFGRQATGEIVPWYFPDAEGCVYRFDAAIRAPLVVGVRLSETSQDDSRRLAEFYLGTEGLTVATTAKGYRAFYNGCDTVPTSTKCAAVVASQPYLAIVYLPFTWADEAEAHGVLRMLVDSITFPEGH